MVYDIDGIDLFVELKLLDYSMSKEKIWLVCILQCIKHFDCFPNAIVVYEILLPIGVTVLQLKVLSKFKLIKYIHNFYSVELN